MVSWSTGFMGLLGCCEVGMAVFHMWAGTAYFSPIGRDVVGVSMLTNIPSPYTPTERMLFPRVTAALSQVVCTARQWGRGGCPEATSRDFTWTWAILPGLLNFSPSPWEEESQTMIAHLSKDPKLEGKWGRLNPPQSLEHKCYKRPADPFVRKKLSLLLLVSHWNLGLFAAQHCCSKDQFINFPSFYFWEFIHWLFIT